MSHSGTFGLSTSGNNLQLHDTANVIPEAANSMLAAAAAITATGRRRRK